MPVRVKAALTIMAIITAFTAASFLLSLNFTSKNMITAMEQELTLALDIADRLVSKQIKLLEADAATVAERILKARSTEEMNVIMAAQIEEFPQFLSLTVLDHDGIVADYGRHVCSDAQYERNIYFQNAFSGEDNIST
ncbi:MAG: hypothetical protein LBJ21_03830, partial [Acidobacteriota bacterium]|nr:hypothetical protein [Acidobacteriota bacterium]